MKTAHPLRRALTVLGLALAAMVLNVGASVLYMVFYGYVIDPGHADVYYEAHAQVAAPWSSIVVGIPLLFFAARWLSRRAGRRDAMMIPVVYITIDAAILLAAGAPARLVPIVVVSFATKLLAAWLGSSSPRTHADARATRAAGYHGA